MRAANLGRGTWTVKIKSETNRRSIYVKAKSAGAAKKKAVKLLDRSVQHHSDSASVAFWGSFHEPGNEHE